MNNAPLPIVVDLDDTLAQTDFFFESFLLFIKQNPFNIFRAIKWLITNDRAYLKSRIAEKVDINVSNIPFNQELIKWIKAKKNKNHKIILATASHQKYANAVADHLGLFDQILATENQYNLKAGNKEKALIDCFGAGGFIYAGDSKADLKVWRSADSALVVSSSKRFIAKVKSIVPVEKVISTKQNPRSLLKAIRIHQWIKNLLLFVPLMMSHNYSEPGNVLNVMIAFFAFSFCSSSVYIINDFFDLEDDRQHSTKRERPFASGQLSIIKGVVICSVCLLISIILSALLGTMFWLAIVSYFLITLLYSLLLKFKMMLDIMILAGLYSLRIIAGAIAINVEMSFWLLSFSMFIFLSLAIMKRHTELFTMKEAGKAGNIKTRGYIVDDMNMLAILGCASGYISVLVMALYVNSLAQSELYKYPDLLWVICIVLLYWVGRTWIFASRGKINEDPILYVIKDKISWLAGFVIIGLFVIAS